jgi:hypothetical protein
MVFMGFFISSTIESRKIVFIITTQEGDINDRKRVKSITLVEKRDSKIK